MNNFSLKKLWHLVCESAAELKNLRSLVGLSMCIALGICLDLFGLDSNFSYAQAQPLVYGPGCYRYAVRTDRPARSAGLIIDLTVPVLHPTGPFFPGFTLTSLLTGTIFGFFLYKNQFSLWRLIVSKTLINLLLNLLLNSLWLHLLYHQGFWIMIPGRILEKTWHCCRWRFSCCGSSARFRIQPES